MHQMAVIDLSKFLVVKVLHEEVEHFFVGLLLSDCFGSGC